MSLKLRSKVEGLALNDLETRRIRRHLDRLANRLANWSDPIVTLLLWPREGPPGVTARVRVRFGHLGGHLVSQESGDSADQAARGALEQVIRQLERHLADLRGEPTFAVPSRREPATHRPARRPAEEGPPER